MQVALTVLNGVHQGRQIPLTGAKFLIGRDKHCNLRPVREDVGREHCAILIRGDRLFLRDYGSTNGTILNDQTLVEGEVPIQNGDVFEVGPLRFQVNVTAQPLPASAPESENDDCFSMNEIFTGQPGEREPRPDSTVQISSPLLLKAARRRSLPDEKEKLAN